MEIQTIPSDKERLKDYDFEMFSKAGNNACRSLVQRLFKIIGGRYRISEEDLIEIIRERINKLQKSHPEIGDTEPGYHIQELVNAKLNEIGYSFRVSRYDF